MADRNVFVSGEWLVDWQRSNDGETTYREVYPAVLKDGHGGPGGFVSPFVTLEVARQIAATQQKVIDSMPVAYRDEMDHLQETSEGVFTLRASYGEQWTIEVGDDGLYDFGFGWTWYEVDEDAVPQEAGAAVEYTIDLVDGEEWRCICGNIAEDSGFSACLADGTVVEPTTEAWTDGLLYLCFGCGRIIRDRLPERPLVVGLRDLDTRPLTQKEILGEE